MMAFWLGLPPWVRTAAMWTGAIILAVVTGKLIIARHDERVLKDERARVALNEAKEQARLTETVNQIGQETGDAKDRALDAPSHVDDVSSVGELRDRYPANSEVILRPREAGSGKGPR